MRQTSLLFVVAFQSVVFGAGHFDFEPPAYIGPAPRLDYWENGQMSWRETACEYGTVRIDSAGGRFPESPRCMTITQPPGPGTPSVNGECQRLEYAFQCVDWYPRRQYWSSWCQKFDKAYPDNMNGAFFAQFKNSGFGWQINFTTAATNNTADPLNLRVTVSWGETATSAAMHTTSFTKGSIKKGEWNDFIVCHYINYDTSSYVQVWLNGVQVVNYHGPIGFKDCTGVGNLKIGIYGGYNAEWRNTLRILSIDEIRGGATRASVETRPGDGTAVQPRPGKLPAHSPYAGYSAARQANAGIAEVFAIDGRMVRTMQCADKSGRSHIVAPGIYVVRPKNGGAGGIHRVMWGE
jgi:hypothetical protein